MIVCDKCNARKPLSPRNRLTVVVISGGDTDEKPTEYGPVDLCRHHSEQFALAIADVVRRFKSIDPDGSTVPSPTTLDHILDQHD